MIHNRRALRRHHKIRLLNKRKKYFILSNVKDERVIGKACKTPSLCSCGMCANQKEETIQEKRNKDIFKEELKEI